MRVETMEYFITLARTGSIRQAAAELYITNQGLSQALQQLESELNTKLLYRHGKVLQLTAAGTVFLKYAERVLSLYEEMKEELRPFGSALANAEKERLTIYVTPIISHTVLSRILSIFQKRFGDYPLSIIEMDAEVLLRDVELNRNSIGILQAPQHLIEASEMLGSGRAELKDLDVSPLLVSAATNSPAAEKRVITTDDLETLPLALYGMEASLARKLLRGKQPQIVFNSANLLLCRDRIAKSNAIGFSNDILEKYVHGPKLTTIPLEQRVDMHTSYMITTSAPLNPVLLDLVYIMHAEIETGTEPV